MMVVTRPLDVLLIEDDPGDELITREAFEQSTVTGILHVARDGQEGLDFLYRRGAHRDAPRPDLILLDLNLPKYDGRQLLQTLKADAELGHIPVVVLSTSSRARGHPAQLPAPGQRLRHQTHRRGSVPGRGAADRRVLRSRRPPAGPLNDHLDVSDGHR